MTNFIRKVKQQLYAFYDEHRILIIVGMLVCLTSTISFACGLILGEELVSSTPLIYTHNTNL
ncbi:MAG: hypothetical protein KGI50_02045 [Patescibacteria group bacterium]|nr:hypothetical protein [Patescibacteria group bacterium]MDE2437873.1 hypothetical protein [Patescibacteria group bacterium]